MVGEAERRQNVENLENELFHLWKQNIQPIVCQN